nr:hypothetical protein [Bacteroidota bacterium]
MKKTVSTLLMAMILVSFPVGEITAQPKTENGYQPVIVQVSLVYPLGTNGKNVDVENYASLNLLAGYAAALKGVEISGIGSVLKDYGEGVQISGLGNVIGSYFKGIQVSGFGNIIGESFEGVQITGFGNINGGHATGIQISGFTNINGSNFNGFQATGFANINGKKMEGLQIAGFMNINGDQTEGLQIAGFANISGGETEGLQIAGFANINESFDGLQIAAFNAGGDVRGMQIGVVNIAENMKGIPFGVFSYVKNGYRKMDVWGNESFYLNAGFKSGISGFYNIVAVGFRPESGYNRYGLTWGLGSEIPLGKGAFMNLEATATQIGEDEIWTNKLNLLNQFKMNFGGMVAPKLGIYAGPTFNVLVSEYVNADGSIGSKIAPSWNFYDHTGSKTNVKIWVGLNVGLRVF